MKVLILALTTVSTMALSNSSYASNSVDGGWSVFSRLCSSGGPAHDSIVLGRDKIVLKIKDGKVQADLLINGSSFKAVGSINYDKKQIQISSEVGSYNVDANDKLNIYTSNLGNAGSCAPGETLTTSLNRL